MSIRYVQFRSDVAVTVGGKQASITSWSTDKNGADVQVEATNDWLFLYIMKDGKRTGVRKRVPMAAIAYIDEDGIEEKAKAKA